MKSLGIPEFDDLGALYNENASMLIYGNDKHLLDEVAAAFVRRAVVTDAINYPDADIMNDSATLPDRGTLFAVCNCDFFSKFSEYVKENCSIILRVASKEEDGDINVYLKQYGRLHTKVNFEAKHNFGGEYVATTTSSKEPSCCFFAHVMGGICRTHEL